MINKVHVNFKYLHFVLYQQFGLLLVFFFAQIDNGEAKEFSFTVVFFKSTQNYLHCRANLQSLHDHFEPPHEPRPHGNTFGLGGYAAVSTQLRGRAADALGVNWQLESESNQDIASLATMILCLQHHPHSSRRRKEHHHHRSGSGPRSSHEAQCVCLRPAAVPGADLWYQR